MRFYAFSYFHWGIMKSSEKSRTLRYGLTEDFFSKGQKTTGGLGGGGGLRNILTFEEEKKWMKFVCLH